MKVKLHQNISGLESGLELPLFLHAKPEHLSGTLYCNRPGTPLCAPKRTHNPPLTLRSGPVPSHVPVGIMCPGFRGLKTRTFDSKPVLSGVNPRQVATLTWGPGKLQRETFHRGGGAHGSHAQLYPPVPCTAFRDNSCLSRSLIY